MKKTKLLISGVLAITAIACTWSGGNALAATRTWVGTDCPATNCNWSNVNNWQGGTAPVNGDDIVINASAATPDSSQDTKNDIANLTVKSISISGYALSGGGERMTIENATGNNTPLTISGNVTYATPASPASSGWVKATGLKLTHGTITLGADSTFTQVYPDPADTYNLNGHVLSFLITTPDINVGLDSLITGSGTLNIEVPITTRVYLNPANTYSGTTNVISTDYISSLSQPNTGMFGTSVVNLSDKARILFSADSAQTINNQFNITPPAVTGTFLNNQLEFWSATAPVTYTVPHITLLGNARFGVNDLAGAVTVNLAGITANGHCVQYGDNNSASGFFQNGPAACAVNVSQQPSTTTAPKAPNTGLRRFSANPLLITLTSLVTAGGLALLARRYIAHTR